MLPTFRGRTLLVTSSRHIPQQWLPRFVKVDRNALGLVTDRLRRCYSLLGWGLLCWTMLCYAEAGRADPDSADQDLERIVAAAEDFMLQQVAQAGYGDVEVVVRSLDPRLRLARCDRPLEAFAPPGTRTMGHTSIGVRCPGSTPWKLYVSAEVRVYGDVVTAAYALPRDAELTQDDVIVVRRNLAELPPGYVIAVEDALGKLTKRTLRPGEVFTHALLKSPQWIVRGQGVTLIAQQPGLTVRASGEALASGAQGERIRVRNNRSGRIVEGLVIAPGVVEVDL